MEGIKNEINNLTFHLSRMTVTGAAAIPLALCIQSAERLEQKAMELEQKDNGEEAADNG